MNIKGLLFVCDADAYKNLEWFLTNVVIPGGYSHLVPLLVYESERYPEINPWGKRSLNISQLREINMRCKKHNITIIPHCDNFRKIPISYPDLAENSGVPSAACPRNEKYRNMSARLIDEIVEVFHPQYFQVGLDEINQNLVPYNNFKRVDQFGICPMCRTNTAAELFAEETNRLNRFLKTKGCKTMIWGDQLLFSPQFGEVYHEQGMLGEYTWQALSMMDRDVIICDWHYQNFGQEQLYPSIDYFAGNGFTVVGCPSVYSVENVKGFTRYYLAKGHDDKLPGMIMTFWGKVARRSESKEDCKYGFIDDSNNLEAILLAGKLFNGKC